MHKFTNIKHHQLCIYNIIYIKYCEIKLGYSHQIICCSIIKALEDNKFIITQAEDDRIVANGAYGNIFAYFNSDPLWNKTITIEVPDTEKKFKFNNLDVLQKIVKPLGIKLDNFEYEINHSKDDKDIERKLANDWKLNISINAIVVEYKFEKEGERSK